jgi:hypothetical protein
MYVATRRAKISGCGFYAWQREVITVKPPAGQTKKKNL